MYCMLCQISLAWRNVKNNGKAIGLLSLNNWHGVKLVAKQNFHPGSHPFQAIVFNLFIKHYLISPTSTVSRHAKLCHKCKMYHDTKNPQENGHMT